LSDDPSSDFKYSNLGIEINETITLSEYNSIIIKDVQRISDYLDKFLLTYDINPQEIDCLFMTGGTSMVKAIQGLFRSKFPHIPINSGDNFKSVAMGLAYSGYLFEDN